MYVMQMWMYCLIWDIILVQIIYTQKGVVDTSYTLEDSIKGYML